MKEQYNHRVLQQLAWFIPVGIAICLMPLTGSRVSPDGASYLAQGLNLYHGYGYTFVDGTPITFRGPVFPWLLSVSFHLFGVSVFSAMLLVRAFFVLNIGVVYLWGLKIGGRFTGLMAALLTLTAFSLHRWSARVHLDVVMPFFILAAIISLYYSFEKKRFWILVCSSLLLGMAILTKEIASLFIPLPILMWLAISEFRTRKHALYILAYYLLLGLIIAPWLYRLIQDEAVLSTFRSTSEWVFRSSLDVSADLPASSMTGETGITSPTDSPPVSIVMLIGKPITVLFDRLKTFYENFFANEFLLAPLFAAAWILTLIRLVARRQRESIFMMLSLLCFIPMILFLGSVSYRAGQAYYFYLLSYIVFSYQLVSITKWMRLSTATNAAILLLLISAQIWIGPTQFSQLFTDQDMFGYVSRSQSYGFSFFREKWTVSDWHANTVVEAGEWLHDNVSPEQPLLSDWQWLESYFFYAGGNQPIHEIEYLSSQLQRNKEFSGNPSVGFIWSQAGRTDPSTPASNLLAFSESHFLSQVKEIGPKYVIFGQRRNFLSVYLRTHPDFIQVAEFGNGKIQIFEVAAEAELKTLEEFPLFASNSIKPYLVNLRSQFGVKGYNDFIQNYFYGELGLDDTSISKLEADDASLFRYNGIITNEEYAKLVQQAEPSLLQRVINTYEQQSINTPNNPWSQLTLTHLYRTNGQNDRIETSFSTAMALADTQPLVYPTLINAYSDLQEEGHLGFALQEQLTKTFQSYADKNQNDVQSYWLLAELYQLLEDWDGAIHTYEQALELWPESAGTVMRMARVYQEQEQFAEAKSAYSMLLTLEPDDAAILKPADIHLEIGKILLAQAQGAAQ